MLDLEGLLGQLESAREELGAEVAILKVDVADAKAVLAQKQEALAKAQAALKAITPPKKRGPKPK